MMILVKIYTSSYYIYMSFYLSNLLQICWHVLQAVLQHNRLKVRAHYVVVESLLALHYINILPLSGQSWGFLLLLFPWARNFTPITSATQLLNREHIVYVIRAQLKSSSIADVVIPVKKNLKKGMAMCYILAKL